MASIPRNTQRAYSILRTANKLIGIPYGETDTHLATYTGKNAKYSADLALGRRDDAENLTLEVVDAIEAFTQDNAFQAARVLRSLGGYSELTTRALATKLKRSVRQVNNILSGTTPAKTEYKRILVGILAAIKIS